MDRKESLARGQAAMKRLSTTDPAAAVMMAAVMFGGSCVRGLVYLCLGYGLVSLFEVSAWWGIPLAVLSSLTLGRLWAWWRREAQVLAIEEAADGAERQASSEPSVVPLNRPPR